MNNKLKATLLGLSLIVPQADAAFWHRVEHSRMIFKTVRELKSEHDVLKVYDI
jgi:hypothetical protein